MNLPLISCIMPTMASRSSFLPQAIKGFQQQSYPNKELVILADEPCLWSVLTKDPSIQFVLASSPDSSIGRKRNEACYHSWGDIIMHLDDDDWYASDWVERQAALLLKSGAELSGLSSVLFYAPENAKAWRYQYPSGYKPWLAGATLAYRRSLWERYPFRPLQVGEDNDFVWNSGGSIATLDYQDGFVSRIHDNNTSPKRTSGAFWTPYPTASITQLLKAA